jgi:hypothetical protein
VDRTSAYILNGIGPTGQNWVRINLPGQVGQPAPAGLRGRIDVPDSLRKLIGPLLTPGTTVIVTADSLQSEPPSQSLTVIDTEARATPPAHE